MNLDPQRFEITDPVEGPTRLQPFPRLYVLFEYDTGERRIQPERRIETTRLGENRDSLLAHAGQDESLTPLFKSRSGVSQKRCRFRSTATRDDSLLGELSFAASRRTRQVELGECLNKITLKRYESRALEPRQLLAFTDRITHCDQRQNQHARRSGRNEPNTRIRKCYPGREQRSRNEVPRLRGSDYDPQSFALSGGDAKKIVWIRSHCGGEAQQEHDREKDAIHGTTPNAWFISAALDR
jgi:hypothetical protein